MIQHIAALTWNESVPDNHAQVCVDALMKMAEQIDSVREYRCGANLGVSAAANADFVVVATFDDVEGWRKYDQFPLHDEVRAQYFKPYIATRMAARFSF
jgi:hypothetical protein